MCSNIHVYFSLNITIINNSSKNNKLTIINNNSEKIVKINNNSDIDIMSIMWYNGFDYKKGE